MLPADSRLTHRDDFALVIRRGQRSGRPRLVVHLHRSGRSDAAPQAGLVVSKAVGGSVIRHRVSRRLRHLLASRLAALPSDTRLVVRALPPAAGATSAELAIDLDAGLRRALRKTPARRESTTGTP